MDARIGDGVFVRRQVGHQRGGGCVFRRAAHADDAGGGSVQGRERADFIEHVIEQFQFAGYQFSVSVVYAGGFVLYFQAFCFLS